MCFKFRKKIIVLTNGFHKKTQKTPKNEILLAEKRKADWLRRNDK
ncbi:MAG: type II toxin-antitoxin system RelE/ParE family toxin [Spirochaetales bacterium]|nr:type II toxin-antitoxin system RelE/ParE family toxin [Spirochaetales bacterium]